MIVRPRKRQKRFVVLSSDDDEGKKDDVAESQKRPGVLGLKNGNASTQSSLASRFQSETLRTTSANAGIARGPRKLAQNHSKNSNGEATSAPAVQSQPIARFFKSKVDGLPKIECGHPSGRSDSGCDSDTSCDQNEDEDIIEDDSPVEKAAKTSCTQGTLRRGLKRRDQNHGDAPSRQRPSNASQRFKISVRKKNDNLHNQVIPKPNHLDTRPWAIRYGPISLEELAVNKRKVMDVRGWLERVWSGKKHQRLLVLRGPSGTGKTTTVEILAKCTGFDVVEWRNPVATGFSSEGYSSMSAQFEDFLARCGHYDKLDFGGVGPIVPNLQFSHHSVQTQNGRSKVVLLDEFPSISLSSSVALKSFRLCLMEYLSRSMSSPGLSSSQPCAASDPIVPLIMVITETRTTSATASSDSFTAHRLLGSDILSHPGVSIIDFNPIAPTFLTKALELVLQKEARQSGSCQIPGPAVLKQLAEVGDVRSAIGSLEFFCIPREDKDDWGCRLAAKGKKGAQASVRLTDMEKQCLEMVTQREFSLGLFHAVGKVVYNKRNEPRVTGTNDRSVTHPPEHLSEHARSRVPSADADELIDQTGCDTSTFIAALHENYVRSCEGFNFIDSLNGCLDVLSDTDVIATSRGSTSGFGGAYQGAGMESMKVDEISFQLAVRGLWFSLPDPVRRPFHPHAAKTAKTGKGVKTDAYKMFYPTSMRLNKQIDDTGDIVDRWLTRLQTSVRPETAVPHEDSSSSLFPEDRAAKKAKLAAQDQRERCRASLTLTKNELLVERLPYVGMLDLHNSHPGRIRELESITKFHGINVLDVESGEDEPEGDAVMPLEGTLPATGADNVQPQAADFHAMTGDVSSMEASGETLYLSDDDIEDD